MSTDTLLGTSDPVIAAGHGEAHGLGHGNWLDRLDDAVTMVVEGIARFANDEDGEDGEVLLPLTR